MVHQTKVLNQLENLPKDEYPNFLLNFCQQEISSNY